MMALKHPSNKVCSLPSVCVPPVLPEILPIAMSQVVTVHARVRIASREAFGSPAVQDTFAELPRRYPLQ